MKKVLWTLLAAAFVAGSVSRDVSAREIAARNASSTVTGTLAVERDASGKTTGARITTRSGTVYALAGFTQTLAALDGKEVCARGEAVDNAGSMTLTVRGPVKTVVVKKQTK